jgi:hypothetical protein
MLRNMLRVTQDVGLVRRWAEERGGRPCRRLDGRVALNLPGDICRGVEIGWDEFQPVFCAGRLAFVHGEEGSRTWFIGTQREAREFTTRLLGHDEPPALARAVA